MNEVERTNLIRAALRDAVDQLVAGQRGACLRQLLQARRLAMEDRLTRYEIEIACVVMNPKRQLRHIHRLLERLEGDQAS